MRTFLLIAILVTVLLSACSGGAKAPPQTTAPSETAVVTPLQEETPPSVATPVESTPIEPDQEPVAAVEPLPPEEKSGAPAPATPPPVQPSQLQPKAAPKEPALVESVTDAPTPVPAATPAQSDTPQAPAAKPAAATLDVATLKERLKETKAIGVFTKLALKNQVDDLLKQFQAHYQAKQQSDIAALRQAYNMLVMKVLSLIQDGDPPLARTVAASREAIWNMLADPVKFKTLM